MSSTVHHNWLHHFRRLQNSAAPVLDHLRHQLKETIMPAAPNAAANTFAPEKTALQARAEAPSSYVEITKDVLAGREEPVSFARLSAHGVACEVAIVLVTPEIAARYLKNQSRNRGLRRRQIEFLTRQLQRGDWKFDGEPLIFNQDNQMIDGQHRCTSCVKSGVPFLTLVVRSIPQEAFDRIDSGARRTASDVLGMEGLRSPKLLAATVGKLIEHQRTGEWWAHGDTLPSHEIVQRLDDYPGLERHVAFARELYRQLGVTPTFWLTALWLTFQISREVAEPFWERVLHGIGLEADDPERLLRQRLTDLKGRAGKLEPSRRQCAAYLANAWNARRRGRPLGVLRGVIADGSVPALV